MYSLNVHSALQNQDRNHSSTFSLLLSPLGKALGEGSLWNDRICSLHGREAKLGRVICGRRVESTLSISQLLNIRSQPQACTFLWPFTHAYLYDDFVVCFANFTCFIPFCPAYINFLETWNIYNCFSHLALGGFNSPSVISLLPTTPSTVDQEVAFCLQSRLPDLSWPGYELRH